MKIYIKIFISLITILFIFSCQPVKNALEGKQRQKVGEEFLIQKKNPLSVPSSNLITFFNSYLNPSSFDELPQPTDNINDEKDSESLNNIEKILGQNEPNDAESSQGNSGNSIEKLISEEINKN